MKIKLGVCVLASMLMASTANAEVKISTKGGLKVSSGDYKFQLGGRIMYDYNKAEENGIVDEDGFNLRRGRIYVKGNIAKNWAFKSQFNTNGGGVEDLYLQYKGLGKAAQIKIGNQKMPFGLEELTSSKDISVLERSAITERYAVGREEGVTIGGALADNIWYGIGTFFVDEDTDDTELGYAARAAFAPVNNDGSVLHFGAAIKSVGDDDAIGLEAAAVAGPFHIQAEFVDGEEGSTDVDGYYVQAGYILTGESRPYKGGKFKRVKPAGNGGAWEVVLRHEDGDGSHSDIELGTTDATATTVGLNWYPHKNVRFGVNYTDGEDNNSSDEGEEFRIRFQLTF